MVRENSSKVNSSKEAVISFRATLVVNLSNRDSVPINNSLSNNNKKISSFSVTTVNSTIQIFKTPTRSILKISQSSDRHPRSSSPEKLFPKKPKTSELVSKELYMPLKTQLSTDLRKWRKPLWVRLTSRSYPESSKPSTQFLMPTSASSGTTRRETNDSDDEKIGILTPIFKSLLI